MEHKITLLKSFKRPDSKTSLISLIIPGNSCLDEYRVFIKSEIKTAQNIKCRHNKSTVMESLTRILKALESQRQTNNGLCCYACSDFLEIFEPIEMLTKFDYFCGKHFFIEPVEDMMIYKNKYKIIHVTGDATIFATLQGDMFKIIETYKTIMPNSNSRKGGQSALRFSRIRDECRHNYITKILDINKEIFKDNNNELFISGSEELRASLTNRINENHTVIAEIDINKVAKKIPNIISTNKKIKEENLVKEFYNRLGENNKCISGEKNVYHADSMNAIETIIISESVTEKYQELLHKIKNIHIISNITQEGNLFESCGGIGAYLKFNIYIDYNDEIDE